MYTVIEIYNKVLSKEFNRFPLHFWQEISDQEIKELLQYFFTSILNYTDIELKEKLNAKLYRKYKLGYLLTNRFNASPFTALDFAYPNKFKIWEFNQVPKGYWKDDNNRLEALKWLMKLNKWNLEELKNNIDTYVFRANNLSGLLETFNNSVFNAVNFLYPNKIKPWELKRCATDYWTKETVLEATEWLIKDILKLQDIKDIKKWVNGSDFKNNGLGGMLASYYKGNVVNAINDYIKYTKRR